MPYSNFEQFAAALCDAAGVRTPELMPDPDGFIAFHMVLQEVVVNLTHLALPGEPSDEVFVLVTFGTVAPEQELEALRLIAETNFALMASNAPVFGMNPVSGEVVLRQCLTLSTLEAVDALRTITHSCGLARQWRLDPTMAPAADTGQAPMHPDFA